MWEVKLVHGLWYTGSHLIVPCTGNIQENLFQFAHDSLRHFRTEKSYASLWDSPNMHKNLETSYFLGVMFVLKCRLKAQVLDQSSKDEDESLDSDSRDTGYPR